MAASKPQLLRTHSEHSSSASEEPLSDYASDVSSTTRLRQPQYDTPPSKISTPTMLPRQGSDSGMTLPTRPVAARPAPLNIRPTQLNNPSVPEGGEPDFGTVTPGIDDTPYIRFAIEQLTRDEEVLGRGRHGSVLSNDFPTRTRIPRNGFGYSPPLPPPPQPPPPPPPPAESSRHSSHAETFTKQPTRDEILLPIAPPTGTQWPDLGFFPLILRLPILLLLVLACLLILTGLIFSSVYASRHHGLYDYDGIGTPRYFVFQFLPQLLGLIILLWLFVLEAAIYRITPFFLLSIERPRDRILQDMPVLPSNFIIPDIAYFRAGEPLLGMVLLVFWLVNWTIPLLSCLYQSQWITNDGPARWRWTTVQSIAWTLFVIYLFLTTAVFYCVYFFRSRSSALMWDPVSLADLVPIFQKSNVFHDYERSEISGSMHTHIPPRSLRLGYWTTSGRPQIFHSVGEENAPVDRTALGLEGVSDKTNVGNDDDSFDVERFRYSDGSSFTRNIHSPFIRYRWAPWFLHDSALIAWVVIAILLLLAFLVVSFVNSAIQHGFNPHLASTTNSAGFSSSNFLYSFLPALFGTFLFLAWQPIDTYFRAVQPFANLSNPAGAVAEHSLLLAYPSCYPVQVTVLALVNRDLKVAWISFVSLMSCTIPVLAGGVFSAESFSHDGTSSQREVRISAVMPAYYALCVFLVVYAFSFLAIFPTRKRYLPHRIHTLADLLSFIYQSPLMTDPAFREVRTKADLVGKLIVAPRGVGENRVKVGAKYAFGIYIGRDGKEHLGVDRLQRLGSGEMLVTTGILR